ncbi:hypothetical protein PanWU01x14_060600 [Parasponia andersonii]|uniref:Uncharacterized protein n=1 Tax=Parasponia andersonii TaxID=3476 RepID=A0A2P5DIU7_PARAD|nr:hypothetical protein PanWU01x14_060600 [Parasponia andersonii]
MVVIHVVPFPSHSVAVTVITCHVSAAHAVKYPNNKRYHHWDCATTQFTHPPDLTSVDWRSHVTVTLKGTCGLGTGGGLGDLHKSEGVTQSRHAFQL